MNTAIGASERTWRILAAAGLVCVATTTTVLAWSSGLGTAEPPCRSCTATSACFQGL